MNPVGIREVTLNELLARLRAPIPPALIERTEKAKSKAGKPIILDTLNVWIVTDLLDYRAPGWTSDVRVIPSGTGDLEHVVTITIFGSDGSISRSGTAIGDDADTDDRKQPGDAATNGYAAAFKRAAAALGLGRALWLKDRPRGWVADQKTAVVGGSTTTRAEPPAPAPAPAAQTPPDDAPGVVVDPPALPVIPGTAEPDDPSLPGTVIPPSPTWALDEQVDDLSILGDEADDWRGMFDAAGVDDPDFFARGRVAFAAKEAVDARKAVLAALGVAQGASDAVLVPDTGAPPAGDPGPSGAVTVDLGGRPVRVDQATGELIDDGAGGVTNIAPPKKSVDWEPKLAACATPADVEAFRPAVKALARQNPRHADRVWPIFWRHKARVLRDAIFAARTKDELKALADQVRELPDARARETLLADGKAAWDLVVAVG